MTAGVYNYMRKEGSKPYSLKDIIPKAYDYIYPPLSEEDKKEQASQSLLAFVLQAPNVPKRLMENKVDE